MISQDGRALARTSGFQGDCKGIIKGLYGGYIGIIGIIFGLYRDYRDYIGVI